MSVSWNEIVDFARGLASEEVRRAIEADPFSRARAELMREVFAAGQVQVPENYLNRAKALLPELPAKQTLRARLVYSSSRAGLRSGPAAAQDLRFEFEGGQVELRIEPAANGRKASVVGLVSSDVPATFRVSDRGTGWIECDEFGQFEVALDPEVKALRIENAMSGDVIEVEIE